MKAARFYGTKPELTVEQMAEPALLPGSAVVEVLAAFVTSSLASYLDAPGGRMLPPLPFVPGMDTIARVKAVADDVSGLAAGDLVYCDHWYQSHNVSAEPDHCFLGFFGMGPASGPHIARWRDGAFAERMMLPAECMTPLGAAAQRASPAQLCRLGWWGTAYGALVKARMKPGETVIVTGASGMVGASGVQIALAMGAARVVAVGRNRASLERVAALDSRVVPVALSGGNGDAAAMRGAAGGRGADVVLDCLGRGADVAPTLAAVAALCFGGRAVLIGSGIVGPLSFDYTDVMYREITVQGSLWFPRKAAAEMIAMIAGGTLDAAAIEARSASLDEANHAVREAAKGGLGLAHWAICPNG